MALRCNLATPADNPPQSLDSIRSLSLHVRGRVWGAVMQCLACRADNKMLLVDVLLDDSTKEPVIERQIYMCSACRHFARRLVFKGAQMPITHLPVITTPPNNLQNGRVAVSSAWTKAVEKLRSKQAALAEQAAVASRVKLAEPVRAPEARSAP
jgi:hypothetical protein